jgi:hypothetical protein
MKLLASLAFGIVAALGTDAADASLVAHWGFDETAGTTAFNSLAGVNGNLVGGVTFTSNGGINGGAIQISNGYVDMGKNFPSTPTFSIQAWVKVAAGDTSGMIPVSKHWAGLAQGYFLAINNIQDGFTQTNTEGFYSGNGPYRTAVGGPSVNDGLWHQLLGVYNNGATSIYVDGQLAGTGSAGYANNSADFMIGGIFSSTGQPENVYRGLIDEVKVFDNSLTASDVQTLYNSTVSFIPIPAAIWLFGSGIAFLAGSRSSRKGT